MRAVAGYSDKTIEQVQAEIEERHKAAESKSKHRSGRRGSPAPATGGAITSGHMDALAGLRAAAEQAKAEAEGQ